MNKVFLLGEYVEKYEGEARYEGYIVSVYSTMKGKTRYVVEVQPQGFQMIVTDKQIRHKEAPDGTGSH